MKHFILPLLAMFAVLDPVSADMVFEKTLIEIQASPGDKTVMGEFNFEIKGKDEKIKDYDAKCSCLAARVEPLNPDRSTKLDWKVGEKGKIMAKFDVENFRGTVDKAIELNLVGASESISLVIRVHVPELIIIEPSSLKWDLGGSAESKVFKIKMNGTEPIRILSHSGNNSNFPYDLKTIKEGSEYEVTVKPVSTDGSRIGLITFRTDSKYSRFSRATAYVVVKPQRNEDGSLKVASPEAGK